MTPILVYYPFSLGNRMSASFLRPRQMAEAFRKNGFAVHLVSGDAVRRCLKALQVLRRHRVRLAYIELPTTPMRPVIDHLVLLCLRIKRVPTGVFVRDAHWRFPSIFGWRIALKYGLFGLIDLAVVRALATQVYVPSKLFGRRTGLRTARPLPPGSEPTGRSGSRASNRLIYAGGIAYPGWPTILSMIKDVRKGDHPDLSLNLAIRSEHEDVALTLIQKTGTEDLISLSTPTPQALVELAESSSIGLIVLERNDYYDAAVSHKLYWYAQYGLPVLTTPNTTMATAVLHHGIGEVFDNSATLSAGVTRIRSQYERYVERVRRFAAENTWEHRAHEVAVDLTGSSPRAAKRKTVRL